MAEVATTTEHIKTLIDLTSISALEALGISIVAGFVSVALIGIARFLYTKGIRDHIQNAIQKTQLNIQGEWLAEGEAQIGDDDCGYTYRDQTTLKQKGRTITGTSIFTTKEDGHEETKVFKLTGFIKNDVIVGTYENSDSQSMGVGSFIYIVINDGKELEGVHQIYNVSERNIKEWPYTLTKK